MNIGFVGGCINSRGVIEQEKAYHSLLKREYPQHNIFLTKYSSYTSLMDKAEQFINTNSLDRVYVFMRHFPYMVLNKPLVKLINKDGKSYYRIHPFLMDRNVKEWLPEYDKYVTSFEDNIQPKRNYFGLRDVNFMVGKSLSLHHWASSYILNLIKTVHEKCVASNAELSIISLPKIHETFMVDVTCKFLNKRLVNELEKVNVDFIEINKPGDEEGDYFQSDKIHFNERGHRYVFEKLKSRIS